MIMLYYIYILLILYVYMYTIIKGGPCPGSRSRQKQTEPQSMSGNKRARCEHVGGILENATLSSTPCNINPLQSQTGPLRDALHAQHNV